MMVACTTGQPTSASTTIPSLTNPIPGLGAEVSLIVINADLRPSIVGPKLRTVCAHG